MSEVSLVIAFKAEIEKISAIFGTDWDIDLRSDGCVYCGCEFDTKVDFSEFQAELASKLSKVENIWEGHADFGLFVTEQSSEALTLAPALIQAFGHSNTSIQVSAYPCSS